MNATPVARRCADYPEVCPHIATGAADFAQMLCDRLEGFIECTRRDAFILLEYSHLIPLGLALGTAYVELLHMLERRGMLAREVARRAVAAVHQTEEDLIQLLAQSNDPLTVPAEEVF
ncbi:MAG: hypothetical protein DDG58_10945 [Ardenticatenia bacterium]|nr:MAG: hypothetical protein DDG58_10945 [Ardenticatenia bacterium]